MAAIDDSRSEGIWRGGVIAVGRVTGLMVDTLRTGRADLSLREAEPDPQSLLRWTCKGTRWPGK